MTNYKVIFTVKNLCHETHLLCHTISPIYNDSQTQVDSNNDLHPLREFKVGLRLLRITVLFAISDQSTCLWALLVATLMGVSKISINTVLRKYIGLQHIQRSGS